MMKGYWQLTLAQLRIFARNRQVIIWSLMFPLLLMFALGTFVGNDNNVSISVGVVQEEKSKTTENIVSAFSDSPGIEVKTYKTEKEALNNLKDGDVSLAVVLPNGLENDVKKKETEPFEIPVFYDETNLAQSQLALNVVNSVVDGVSKATVKYEPIVVTKAEGMQGLQLRYIDFLVPGIVAMMIMSNNMNGVAGQIAAWRERGILRRMQGTRLKASTFIAAQITARLVLNGIQATLVLLIANLVFDISVRGSWFALLFFVILGTLAFMSLGFIIASIAKTPESAGPIAGLITFPLLFLGGVFFPISNMPDILQPIVHALPIAHLSTALRETMNIGVSFTSLWVSTVTLIGWLVFGFTVASRTFKWDYE